MKHKSQDTRHKTSRKSRLVPGNGTSKLQVMPQILQRIILLSTLCSLLATFSGYAQGSGEYVSKGWAELGKRNFPQAHQITDNCIQRFSSKADALAQKLTDFPPEEKESFYQVMNDVAVCYFIKGEAYMRSDEVEEAKKIFKEVIEKYPFALAWDPRGWFWSVKEKAEITLKKLQTGIIEEEEEEEEIPSSQVILHDAGDKPPVDYEKYGEFIGVGTKEYKYIIKDPVGLSEAVGEAVYPNSSSVKFDPEFNKIKKKLRKIDHWKILNTKDLSTAFYTWTMAPEPNGVKLFYIGDILERSGEIKHAIKAYYAVIVHFPKTVGWTYWHTPWYIGKAALYRIKFLLKKHPELNLELKDAYIKVQNGTNHQIRDDIFIINPGRLTKKSFKDRFFACEKPHKTAKIVKVQGKGKVQLVKYSSGGWQLLVEQKPFMIQGLTYDPTRVGESPDEGTLANWTFQDTNNNGIIDAPYETWVDKNKNDARDKNERTVGDFQLMKDMGVNCLRVYYKDQELNKELFRDMYENYGIYVGLGNFLGKYAIGSGASWEEGTDYDNPQHKENMLKSIETMVNEFKDEPYILMWILGNENVYGLGCNADKKPESFFAFANRAAQLIKRLDPLQRPVAIASGDSLFLDIFGKQCPDIDIFGTNSYRGKYGFLDLWEEVKELADKAVMITEYGVPSHASGYTQKEAQNFQAEYHINCWHDMYNNRCRYGVGNVLGGFAFEWLDEWWKAYEPSYHDKKGLFTGPFLDGYMHEEWLGICGQGKGTHSPFLRQLKKVYFSYKEVWSRK